MQLAGSCAGQNLFEIEAKVLRDMSVLHYTAYAVICSKVNFMQIFSSVSEET